MVVFAEKVHESKIFQRKPGLFSVSIIQKGTIRLWYL